MSYRAAIASARSAWAGGAALNEADALQGFREAIAAAAAEAPEAAERVRWTVAASFASSAARLRSELDGGLLFPARRVAVERSLERLRGLLAGALEEGGAPCSARCSIAQCEEPAHLVVADAEGGEAAVCEAHWREALERSGGSIRAIRFVGPAEAQRS